MQKQTALTITSTGLANILKCDVMLTPPFVANKGVVKNKVISGIWDTGATNSCVNEDVIDALGLQPIGMTQVNTASDTVKSNVYLVDVVLPSNVLVQGVKVTKAKIVGADMLIGMDIINLGDLAITNHNGKTVMSFRFPSCHQIDYVQMIDNERKQRSIAKYLPKPNKKKRKSKARK